MERKSKRRPRVIISDDTRLASAREFHGSAMRTTLGLDSARAAISANAQIRTQLKLPGVGLLSWCGHGAGQHGDSSGADEMLISGRMTESVNGLGFRIANFESRIGEADGEAARGKG